jgi:ABC-type enterobactin transport system permease subunit
MAKPKYSPITKVATIFAGAASAGLASAIFFPTHIVMCVVAALCGGILTKYFIDMDQK